MMVGVDVYKRFSTDPQFKRQEYNGRLNPQQCGFGYRKIRLSARLDKIEFRSPLKP